MVAYKGLDMKQHQDKNNLNQVLKEGAETMFKQIAWAYDALSDRRKCKIIWL